MMKRLENLRPLQSSTDLVLQMKLLARMLQPRMREPQPMRQLQKKQERLPMSLESRAVIVSTIPASKEKQNLLVRSILRLDC